jgi:hypothetical protein
VSWFRRKKHEVGISTSEVPMTTLYRWFLYDTGLDDANKLAELVGLSRVSEEGDVKEQEDSDQRLSYLYHLLPYIDAISDMAADTFVALQEGKDSDGLTEEEVNASRIIYKAVSMASLIGALSIGLHIGVLDSDVVGGGKVEMEMDIE